MITLEKHGPWAVIAGASEGLGEVLAERLAAAGLNLVLLARSAAKMEAIAAKIRSAHPVEVRCAPVDLTALDMLDAVAAATDGLEVGSLFYVAGAGGDPVMLIDQLAGDALHTIKLNVIGQTLLAQHFGAGMAARGRGAIMLFGSLGCVTGGKRLAVYAASKAYTQIFAEGLWAELEPLGVDVTALLIGRTRTPMLERSSFGKDSDMAAAEPADVIEFALANISEGPVIVPPELQGAFDGLRSMPRRKAVQVMSRSLDGQTS